MFRGGGEAVPYVRITNDETSLFVLTWQPKLPRWRNICVPESCPVWLSPSSQLVHWKSLSGWLSGHVRRRAQCSPSDNAPRISSDIACRYRHGIQGYTRLLGPYSAFLDSVLHSNLGLMAVGGRGSLRRYKNTLW
jgi:hypothetical protein